jgi:hypothetical protein
MPKRWSPILWKIKLGFALLLQSVCLLVSVSVSVSLCLCPCVSVSVSEARLGPMFCNPCVYCVRDSLISQW